MKELTMGQYYAADSVVHRLDPRTKLMAVVVYITVLFFARKSIWYLPMLICLLVLYRVAQIPFSYLLKGVKGILLLLCLTFFMRLICTPGDVIAKVWVFGITSEGLIKAIRLTSRIALMVVGTSLLSYTTTPRQLADGFERAFSFLEKYGVPIQTMSVIIMIAFRFIPVLVEETNILMDAQKARGAEFEHCSAFKKCKNVWKMLLPLFLSSVQRSSDLAMAMEARGYREEQNTTRMYPLEYKREDRIAYFCMVVYAIVIIGCMCIF